MKKILFLLSNFERGGIPRVTINLVGEVKRVNPDWCVDIFCANPQGIFYEQAQQEASHLIPGLPFLQCFIGNWKQKKGIIRFNSLILRLLNHILKKNFRFDLVGFVYELQGRKLAKFGYDIVWATSEDFPAELARYITAEKKILWIHNDYSQVCPLPHERFCLILENFDKIVCVAEHVRNSFLEKFPVYVSNTFVLYNPINHNEISRMSEQLDGFNPLFRTDNFTIISIGRFCHEKNFESIPGICAQLLKNGVSFCWYIIGSGGKEEKSWITKEITKYNVEKNVVLLGEQKNPYQYLKRASLYVLTSRHEAYPTVCNEAKVLKLPIVSTNIKGIGEILGEEGISVPLANMAQTITDIIQKKICLSKQNSYFNAVSFNKVVIKKFLSIIGE